MENRELLEKRIETILFEEVKTNRRKVDALNEELKKYGVSNTNTMKILMRKTELTSLADNVLCCIASVTYEITKADKIKPELYFSEEEMGKYLTNKIINVNDSVFPLKLEGVQKEGDRSYLLETNSDMITKLMKKNVLTFNYSIKKQYKLSRDNAGNVQKVIDLDSRRIKQIAKAIMSADYEFQTIILNSQDEGKFNFSNGTLTIDDCRLEIVSGLYDIAAINYVYDIDEDFSTPLSIELKNYSLDEITRYFINNNLKGGSI